MNISSNILQANYILLTRPLQDSENLRQEILDQTGRQSLIAPILDIQYIHHDVPIDTAEYAALLFTSAHAVTGFYQENNKRNEDVPVFAIGEKTAQSVQKLGIGNLYQGDGTSEEICRMMREHMGSSVGPVLHPCGQHVSPALQEAIKTYGLNVRQYPVYEAVAATEIPGEVLEEIRGQKVSDVIFYSARTATIFCELMKKYALENFFKETRVLCLSGSVVKSVEQGCWREIKVAETPSTCAILDLLKTP